MLCCAVLCRAVLCCAVLCCAVLCIWWTQCAVLCCAALCCAVCHIRQDAPATWVAHQHVKTINPCLPLISAAALILANNAHFSYLAHELSKRQLLGTKRR